MINLNEVKQQINESIPWRDGVLTVEQARALVAEVEILRQEARIRNNINDGLAAELKAERTAVVRYMSEGEYVCASCKDIAVSELAAGIERGEHRKEAP